MGMYRTSRPMIVDALQCTEAKTVATDLGFINAKCGEWIICGEGGECYIVDDGFFQRTFVSLQDDSRQDDSRIHVVSKPEHQVGSGISGSEQVQISSRACINRERTHLSSHSVRGRTSRTRGK